MQLRTFATFGCLLALSAHVYAYGPCGLTVAYGKSRLSGISTAKIDTVLTTEYSQVNARVDPSDEVTELGLECPISHRGSLAVSTMRGLRAEIHRDVRFTGFTKGKLTIEPMELFDVTQIAEATAMRLSYLHSFNEVMANSAPFVRLGIEHIRAKHVAGVTIGAYTLSKADTKKLTAPYLGFGLTLYPKNHLSYRLEVQIKSPKPHSLMAVTAGVVLRF